MSKVIYKNVPEDIKTQLKDEINKINDNQNPENLYNNIVNSTGTVGVISNLFELPFGLVMKIRELNKLV